MVDDDNDGRRTPDHGHPISSQGELKMHAHLHFIFFFFFGISTLTVERVVILLTLLDHLLDSMAVKYAIFNKILLCDHFKLILHSSVCNRVLQI